MIQTYQGLNTPEIATLRAKFGRNALPEKKKNIFLEFLKQFVSPVSLMLLAAAILSFYAGNIAGFWIILFLFFSNFAISFWQEKKADTSIKELQKSIALKINALRDGQWASIDSTELLPGDIVALKVGTVVPADVNILDSKNLSFNESTLTGESLPKQKGNGDTGYSGSFVTTGNATGKVTAIGASTFFGKTITSIDMRPRQSSLEKDILSISKFISITSIIVVIILTAVLVSAHSSFVDVLTLDLSLLIAGIPVALPTVMSLIISIGVFELAKKRVIVRRLASLEDLANVDLLLSDKTGTLTQNSIKVARIEAFGKFSENDAVQFALSAIADTEDSPIDSAVLEKGKDLSLSAYSQLDYIPGDSERKRSTAIISLDGKKCVISLGAPQIVVSLCSPDSATKIAFEKSVESAGKNGYRALAVAINKSGAEEKNMELVGILFLADVLHPDAKSTVEFMNQNGIAVKMLTGDSFEISKRVAEELGLDGVVRKRDVLDENKDALKKDFDSISVFSEVLPKDKYDIVSIARGHHTVAMTGDGVNDLPAVKNADVGFAVNGAVDALKSAADIVLLKEGISVIKDAIIEARKIFTRLYNYSLYRISESFRLIITIAVIGFIYRVYPLTPVELIALAFLNDVPIVSLAFDRVKVTEKPAHIDAKKRFTLSTLFGLTGTANSLILFFVMTNVLHLPWSVIQTVFFLKLTVSGHMLVYVAHTKETWFKYLPSRQVIIATLATQAIATVFAFTGFLVAPISLSLIALVWVWSFFWMQISELMKHQTWLKTS